MKILHVFSDPRIGGPGTRTLDIARRLRDEDVESIFAIPEGQDSLANAAKDEGHPVERIQLSRLRAPRRVWDNVRFFAKFSRTVSEYYSLINQTGADIVHVNTPYNFQPALAASRSNAKLVWHFNDTLTPWPINKIASRMARHIADVILADSQRVVDYFSLPDGETQIIYPCVDVDTFGVREPLEQIDFEASSREPKIGCVANINPVKGQNYLIKALPGVIRNIGPVSLQIVGAKLDSQERYYEQLQNLVEANDLHDYVSFIGWQSDIPEFLSEIDLLVIPSVSESGPITLLEAMAVGVPVVTTDVGIVREQVVDGKHAWVVSPKSVDELESTITTALQSPNTRQRYAANARELVEAEFSLETISNQYQELYYSVLMDGR